jgi:hypothetical protein
MTTFLGSKGLIDLDQRSLASKFKCLWTTAAKRSQQPSVAAAAIAFNPIFWK